MCGIAGALDWSSKPDLGAVDHMTRVLAHRGPDGDGLVETEHVAFGHRRLAVIDLSDAALQPMWDRQRQILITFNGEIYNYRELRAELEERGVRFATHSDTEVILEAYKVFGLDALSRFNGMFAFSLWDATAQRLVLARDRMGEKPLFWRRTANGLAFASELNALRHYPGHSGEVDATALRSFLSIGYVCGSRALDSGVNRLAPAHCLVWDKGQQPRTIRYWNLAERFHDKRSHSSVDQASAELRALLDDSVRLRMIADVPVGAFLSGGVDSATIVAAMRATAPDSAVHTYSIAFDEPGFDESALARESARALGSEHRDRLVSSNLAQRLPEIIALTDEPIADSSLFPTFELAAFARERTTVSLSGDGGDELFAGYATYRADMYRASLAQLPSILLAPARMMVGALKADTGKVSLRYKLRQFLENVDLPAERAHYAWRQILPDTDVSALMGDGFAQAEDPFAPFADRFAEVRGLPLIDAAGYVDQRTWMVDDILVKVDRASMAHALEVRTPFLDHRVVEFAATLPLNFKMQGFKQKRVLKASQQHRLPQSVLSRPKAGFNAPVSRWFATALAEHFERTVINGPAGSLVDVAVARRLRDDHQARRRDYGLALFALTSLGLWLESRQ